MKLIFDRNLSFKLSGRLSDLFPGSTQVRLVGLEQATDLRIWEFAKEQGFTIVTLDADFTEIAALFGPPPHVVWLRCGNRRTDYIETLLRKSAAMIDQLGQDGELAFLEVL